MGEFPGSFDCEERREKWSPWKKCLWIPWKPQSFIVSPHLSHFPFFFSFSGLESIPQLLYTRAKKINSFSWCTTFFGDYFAAFGTGDLSPSPGTTHTHGIDTMLFRAQRKTGRCGRTYMQRSLSLHRCPGKGCFFMNFLFPFPTTSATC